MGSGNIVEIIGAVVDVEFPRDAVPKIYHALKVQNGLTLEVQQQIGDGVVILGSSDGVEITLEQIAAWWGVGLNDVLMAINDRIRQRFLPSALNEGPVPSVFPATP